MPYLLKQNGDFLLRTTEPKPGEPKKHVISVMINQSAPIEEGVNRRACKTKQKNRFSASF